MIRMKIQAQLLLADWTAPPAVVLTDYDVILINTSAGKDSQTLMREIFDQATAAGVTDRLVAVHCDLGRIEWSGTLSPCVQHPPAPKLQLQRRYVKIETYESQIGRASCRE